MTLKKALTTYKALRKIGISLSDICRLVNWTEARKIADKTGLAWLKLLVSALGGICSLTPERQLVFDEIVEEIDKQLV